MPVLPVHCPTQAKTLRTRRCVTQGHMSGNISECATILLMGHTICEIWKWLREWRAHEAFTRFAWAWSVMSVTVSQRSCSYLWWLRHIHKFVGDLQLPPAAARHKLSLISKPHGAAAGISHSDSSLCCTSCCRRIFILSLEFQSVKKFSIAGEYAALANSSSLLNSLGICTR